MKRILLLVLIALTLVAIPITASFSQALPFENEAVYLGPVYKNDCLGVSFGTAHQIGAGPTWTSAKINIDKQSAEAEAEFFALFEVPNIGLWAGPAAAFGADWTNGQESLMTYLKTTSGAVAAYPVTEQVGAWAFAKYRFALGDNSYGDKNTWLAGVGFYLML